MKKLFYFIFPGICLASCWWLPMPPPKFYSPFIYYQNTKGQDLLDTITPFHYYKDSIFLYWYANGANRQSVANVTQTLATNTSYPIPNGYSIKIPCSTQIDTWIIQLNKYDFDTVTYVFSKATLEKVYYNKTIIKPPSGQNSLDTYFPIIVTKNR